MLAEFATMNASQNVDIAAFYGLLRGLVVERLHSPNVITQTDKP